MTSLTAITRTDRKYLDPINQSFVLKKSTKLVESPRIRASSFSLVSRLLISSFSNASQIFNSNNTIRLFSTQNYRFTDDMVDMALKSFLLTRQPFQQCATSASATACAFRGFLLEISALFRVFISYITNFSTRPFFVIGLGASSLTWMWI